MVNRSSDQAYPHPEYSFFDTDFSTTISSLSLAQLKDYLNNIIEFSVLGGGGADRSTNCCPGYLGNFVGQKAA